MNISKIRRAIHTRVRLRPAALSVDPHGNMVEVDHVWILNAVSDHGVVELHNQSTGHTARLGTDHIHHFDTDPPSNTDGLEHGFLFLTMQVFLRGPQFSLEPVARLARDAKT